MPQAGRQAPGELLARGRAADVFAAGPDRVLRRYREGEGGDVQTEALAMEHARQHGFPVPAVYAAHDHDLLLERVDGPTMLGDLAKRPWLVGRHGRTLGALHNRLHEIPAPGELPIRFGEGDRLLHFDLHPDNVILSPRGPVVIDWSGASRGNPADDVALTWVILATAVVHGPRLFRVIARVGRSLLVDAFLSSVEHAEAAGQRVAAVAGRRLQIDPHLLAPERAALQKLIAHHS